MDYREIMHYATYTNKWRGGWNLSTRLGDDTVLAERTYTKGPGNETDFENVSNNNKENCTDMDEEFSKMKSMSVSVR